MSEPGNRGGQVGNIWAKVRDGQARREQQEGREAVVTESQDVAQGGGGEVVS